MASNHITFFSFTKYILCVRVSKRKYFDLIENNLFYLHFKEIIISICIGVCTEMYYTLLTISSISKGCQLYK